MWHRATCPFYWLTLSARTAGAVNERSVPWYNGCPVHWWYCQSNNSKGITLPWNEQMTRSMTINVVSHQNYMIHVLYRIKKIIQSNCHSRHTMWPMPIKTGHSRSRMDSKSMYITQGELYRSRRGTRADIWATLPERTRWRSDLRNDVLHYTKPRAANDYRHSVLKSVYRSDMLEAKVDQTFWEAFTTLFVHIFYLKILSSFWYLSRYLVILWPIENSDHVIHFSVLDNP